LGRCGNALLPSAETTQGKLERIGDRPNDERREPTRIGTFSHAGVESSCSSLANSSGEALVDRQTMASESSVTLLQTLPRHRTRCSLAQLRHRAADALAGEQADARVWNVQAHAGGRRVGRQLGDGFVVPVGRSDETVSIACAFGRSG